MPSDLPALPSTWINFVESIVLGASPEEAARAMGYEQPRKAAAQMIQDPQVRKALIAAAEARIECEALPLALDVIREILTDRDQRSRAVRAKLALGIIDRLKKKDVPKQEVSASDMGKDALEQLVAQLEAADIQPGVMRNITGQKAKTG